MQNITIWSEAFKNGESIPVEYTCDGEDMSPALSWNNIPPETKSITLVMEDPDAPSGIFVHWILFNIPSDVKKFSKGIADIEQFKDGSSHGTTSFGRFGYGGPCPPSGTHRYYFKIFALDTILNLGPCASMMQVDIAMRGHILTTGELMGLYRRRKQ